MIEEHSKEIIMITHENSFKIFKREMEINVDKTWRKVVYGQIKYKTNAIEKSTF